MRSFIHRLDIILEAYCTACGGFDPIQGGKGHKIGCPVGKAGESIAITQKVLSTDLIEINVLLNSIRSDITTEIMPFLSKDPSSAQEALVPLNHMYQIAARLKEWKPRYKFVPDLMSLIANAYDDIRQSDIRGATKKLIQIKSRLNDVVISIQHLTSM